ncbi:MAG: undecaprenyl/decaprenyl-phosphate alpha-N-acetylglucosaminyl 1-phosphate transferase [Patescibacteria group bacterium]|nr:undecaprenyl/decaprenyl-phosphate alpha-N-acetylglucosaminyl 1-phosphate transferase [Patescibacteria group bacterium]MCL5431783.1 undecaprenyl/decaprenyl-phosphate alpha-N-acetylglucosaminyl 1-phosphate transferase [Patescibacteria group bacterium]
MIVPLLKNIGFLPLLTAAFLTFISVPAVIQAANYLGLIDDPKKRSHPAHTETRVIPRAGGLALYFGIVLASAIFIPFAKGIAGILLGAGLLMLVGLIDDYHDVHPYVRFGVNVVAAMLAVAGGAGIGFITNPVSGGIIHFDTVRWSFEFLGKHSILPIADLLAIIWLVWTANIVGWSSGVDGQMPGFVAISAIVIGILSFSQISIDNFPVWTGTALAFITAGAYLGFLPWNFFPQKIMPGYGGKSLAGFLLGTLAILSVAKLGTAILVLGVPLMDSFYVVTSRILARKNPTWSGRDHLHHRLLDAGWSKRKIALFYWGVSAILGMVALTVNARQKFFAVVMVAVIVLMLILWLKLSSIFLRKSASDNG